MNPFGSGTLVVHDFDDLHPKHKTLSAYARRAGTAP